MKNEQKIGSVFETTRYSMFKRLDGQRAVEHSRVLKVLRSIREVGQIIPVIVNEKMEVIDGQARIEACKILGIPVRYVVMIGTGIEECRGCNSTASMWTLLGYISSFAELGNNSYIFVLKLFKRFAETIPTHAILTIAFGRRVNTNTVRNGDLCLGENEYNRAVKTLEYVETFSEVLDRQKGRKDLYYTAVAYAYTRKGVDAERLKKKVFEIQNLPPAATMEQAIKDIEAVYNRNARDKAYMSYEYKKMIDAKASWYEET